MALALGIAQLALTLYGRNVVIASAHEGVRAATELGRDIDDAEIIARRTTRSAAGSLVNDMEVIVGTRPEGEGLLVTVRITGRLESLGPVPVPVPIDVTATSRLPEEIE